MFYPRVMTASPLHGEARSPYGNLPVSTASVSARDTQLTFPISPKLPNEEGVVRAEIVLGRSESIHTHLCN